MTDNMTPRMTVDQAEEYTAALGQSLGGQWRQVRLAVELGVPQLLGMSTEEWVRLRLGGYIKLSIGERREAIAELRGEGLSQRAIADVVGVGVATVNRDVRVPDGTEPARPPHNGAPSSVEGVPSGTPESLEDATADTAATTNVTSIGVAPDLTPVEGRAIDPAPKTRLRRRSIKARSGSRSERPAVRTIQPVLGYPTWRVTAVLCPG